MDQLHDEIGPAGFRGPGVEDAGDVDVVHHGQCLPLGLETSDDLTAIHTGLDHFERDLALNWLGLLGHPDYAHAAFADRLQQFVRADHGAGAFRIRLLNSRLCNLSLFRKKTAGLVVGAQQCVNAGA